MKQAINTLTFLLTSVILLTSCQKEETKYQRPPDADAGQPQIVILPTSAATLTGTAKSYNGPIKGYLWSLISGPNVPKIESPSSISTQVSGLVLGTYSFQFMAIDSAGLTGIDTVSVSVQNVTITYDSKTLQPSNNSYEGLLNIFYPTTFGNNQQLLTEAWTSGGNPFTVRSIVKFDYTGIPTGATVDNATLYLYSDHAPLNGNLIDANFGTNNAFYVERLTSSWTLPTPFTWNNPPSSTTSNRVTVPHSANSFEDISINLTQIVKDQFNYGNNGIIMKLTNEVTYNIRQFYSSKSTVDASKHPKLVINYHY